MIPDHIQALALKAREAVRWHRECRRARVKAVSSPSSHIRFESIFLLNEAMDRATRAQEDLHHAISVWLHREHP